MCIRDRLKLIREAYGVTRSTNGLILYVVGKGKFGKEGKFLIENFVPTSTPEDIIIALLNQFHHHTVDSTDLVQLILERHVEYVDVVNLLLILLEDYRGSVSEMKEKEERVKSQCSHWNTPVTQFFIARITYHLLVLADQLGNKSQVNVKREVELILFKEHVKKKLEDERVSMRLLYLYCILASDSASKDKILWNKLSEKAKSSNFADIKDKCVICKEKIRLFAVKNKSTPIEVGTIFPKNDLPSGRVVQCTKKHKNMVLLDELRVKKMNELIHECSVCRCTQQLANPCFMCGSYCYKLP
eukprot:TRINITY_DN10729_c0_g1_i1.p1 TRINITY_DN10729_c0_g1~~TRINITY_DN10729_c0_g1_i1.p1  ORF type:complete len:300 (+),score=69.12 TRINITY_DN10729_c0_g1_i1:73-972(+)